MIRGLSLLLGLLLFAAPTPASAKGATEQLLRQAEQYYEQLEYEAALKVLIAVQQQKDATPIQRARAYLYMGVCFTALGNNANAVLAFMEVLKLRPRFRLPQGVSPSIRTMFAEALKRLKLPAVPPPPKRKPPKPPKPKTAVDIKASGPRRAVAGKPLTVTITIDDAGKRIDRLLIFWRRIGGPDFSKITVKPKKGAVKVKATIPGAVIGAATGRLTYYVEARNADGSRLARSANEDEPFEVTLTAAPKKKSSWGWWVLGITGAAAAIAGGVIATIFLLRDSGSTLPPNTADVTVTIE